MIRRPATTTLLVIASLAGLALTACGDTATGGSSSSPGGSASSPGGSQSSAGKGVVDLTFSGAFTFVAKGSAGCRLSHDSSGAVVFGFDATEHDYAGMGDAFDISQFNGRATIKWVVGGGVGYLSGQDTGVTLSADQHTATIDAVLPASKTGAEHVKGTIFCP